MIFFLQFRKSLNNNIQNRTAEAMRVENAKKCSTFGTQIINCSNFGTPLPLRGGFPPKLQPHVCAHTQALSP